MPRPPEPRTLVELKAAVGGGHWLDSPHDVAPYVEDFRRLYHGATPLVLQPGSTAEVSKILALCHAADVAVVPVASRRVAPSPRHRRRHARPTACSP